MSNRSGLEDTRREFNVAGWTRGALTALVALVMFAMMMLTTVDVAGRALGRPIRGSFEIVTFMLAILIFCSIPLITWDEKHIKVNLFDRWIPASILRALNVLWVMIMTVVMAGITYRMWIQAKLMAEGQHITGALEWPIAPVVYFMTLMCGLTTIILGFLIWQKLVQRTEPVASTQEISAENAGVD
ncbi:MAG: TRAP transporter small permease [Xanthobacteraceae bacterium]